MSIAARLIGLRKDKAMTQQEMADAIGLHVNQVRRYETGSAQPSLEALKKIAVAMSVTIDSLVFADNERGPDEELKLQFEAVSRMSLEDRRAIKALLDGMIIKHQTRQMVGNLGS
jgi:transcriptional regulator with XRE-family HTH domain